jgi:hypothetical protein
VVEYLLKLRCCFRALPELQVRLATQVLRPEFGGGFVARGSLRRFNGLRRIAALRWGSAGEASGPR